MSGSLVGDVPSLEELRERATAAVSGNRLSAPDDVESLLATGQALIESWTPRIVVDGVPFVLDRPTGRAHHRDGSTTWRAAWRPELDSYSVLHTDGGVSAHLTEAPDPFGQGFISHLSEDEHCRLIHAQPEIDAWLDRGAWISENDRMLAAYLAERESWLTLARDEVYEALNRIFIDSDRLPRIVPSPVVTAPICHYLAVAYTYFAPVQRETLMVLIADGMPLLTAIDTARALWTR